MAVYVTGDTHGIHNRIFQLDLKDGDILLVCGDFSYVFYEREKDRQFLDRMEEMPYTVAFVDGNHENFPAIFSYPEEDWKGGRIHRIRKNIIHLMRGHVFDIEGKTFFTMGGAYSTDRASRAPNYTYWEEELPNDGEYKQAIASLTRADFRVDYVLTHTAPQDIILRMGIVPDLHDGELTGFLGWVMEKLQFSHWYFGHWHFDRQILDNVTAIYEKTIQLI